MRKSLLSQINLAKLSADRLSKRFIKGGIIFTAA
jgi:hypothetical protein